MYYEKWKKKKKRRRKTKYKLRGNFGLRGMGLGEGGCAMCSFLSNCVILHGHVSASSGASCNWIPDVVNNINHQAGEISPEICVKADRENND